MDGDHRERHDDDAASLRLTLPDHNSTERLGRCIAGAIESHAVIALLGPMGAGKTTLVQGLARQLGITEAVSSPTFTMLNEYRSGRLPLYHLDLYRLSEDIESISNLLAAEVDEFIDKDMIAVFEWAELFKTDSEQQGYISQLDHLVVQLEYADEVKASEEGEKKIDCFYVENGRNAILTAVGTKSRRLILDIKSALMDIINFT